MVTGITAQNITAQNITAQNITALIIQSDATTRHTLSLTAQNSLTKRSQPLTLNLTEKVNSLTMKNTTTQATSWDSSWLSSLAYFSCSATSQIYASSDSAMTSVVTNDKPTLQEKST